MGTEAHACHSRPGHCANCGDATTRGRTCSAACARAWASGHVWSAARRVALARAGFRCEDCGELDWSVELQVHHVEPVDPIVGYRPSCAHRQDNLRVLCATDHALAHLRMGTRPGSQLPLFASR